MRKETVKNEEREKEKYKKSRIRKDSATMHHLFGTTKVEIVRAPYPNRQTNSIRVLFVFSCRSFDRHTTQDVDIATVC